MQTKEFKDQLIEQIQLEKVIFVVCVTIISKVHFIWVFVSHSIISHYSHYDIYYLYGKSLGKVKFTI